MVTVLDVVYQDAFGRPQNGISLIPVGNTIPAHLVVKKIIGVGKSFEEAIHIMLALKIA